MTPAATPLTGAIFFCHRSSSGMFGGVEARASRATLATSYDASISWDGLAVDPRPFARFDEHNTITLTKRPVSTRTSDRSISICECGENTHLCAKLLVPSALPYRICLRNKKILKLLNKGAFNTVGSMAEEPDQVRLSICIIGTIATGCRVITRTAVAPVASRALCPERILQQCEEPTVALPSHLMPYSLCCGFARSILAPPYVPRRAPQGRG